MNVPNKDSTKKQVDELKHHDFKALLGWCLKPTPKRDMFGKAMIMKHDKKIEWTTSSLAGSEICEMFMPLAAPEFAARVILYGPEN